MEKSLNLRPRRCRSGWTPEAPPLGRRRPPPRARPATQCPLRGGPVAHPELLEAVPRPTPFPVPALIQLLLQERALTRISGTHRFCPCCFTLHGHIYCAGRSVSRLPRTLHTGPDRGVGAARAQPVCGQHVTGGRVRDKLNHSQASALPSRAPRGLEMVRWPFKNQQ